MRNLVYVTSNPVKAQRLGLHLQYPVEHQNIDLPEIQSLDVREVVEHKVRAAYAIVGRPVLVEDYSLQVHALGNLPGPLVKWFMQGIGAQGICTLLGQSEDRSATTQVCLGYFDGTEVRLFLGERRGHVPLEPRGEGIFGPDTIFIPDGWDVTWAEMNEDQRLQSSVRGLAMSQFKEFIQSPS